MKKKQKMKENTTVADIYLVLHFSFWFVSLVTVVLFVGPNLVLLHFLTFGPPNLACAKISFWSSPNWI